MTGVRFAPLTGQDVPYLKPGHGAQITTGDERLGTIGELSTKVLENFGLKQAAYYFDLNFDRLVDHVSEEKHAKALSRFPATTRDMAMIVDDHLEAQRILDFMVGLNQELIEGIQVFDVYKGSPIPEGKKSMALRFTYRSFERTVTDSEVNSIHETMTQKTLEQFNAQLPSS